MSAQAHPPGTILMRPMLDSLARNWWLILLRGLCAIIFGLLTLAWPGLSLFALVILYGVFALFDGGLAIGAAIIGDTPAPRRWLALAGVAGIAAGTVALAWPDITGFVLLFFIAGWAFAAGVFEIAGAIRLRKEIDNEWLLIASGVLSVLFGVLILLFPAKARLDSPWLSGRLRSFMVSC